MSVPPFVIAFVCTSFKVRPSLTFIRATAKVSLVSAVISDRYQCRGCTAILFSFLKTIGFTLFYGKLHAKESCQVDELNYPASKSNFIRYGSIVLSITSIACSEPALISWLVSNSAPNTRRATAVAMALIMTELGGIISPWLFESISLSRHYTIATTTFIVMSIGMVILSMANLAYLRRQNCLKAERRQWMRKEDEPEGLGDRSAWFIYSL